MRSGSGTGMNGRRFCQRWNPSQKPMLQDTTIPSCMMHGVSPSSYSSFGWNAFSPVTMVVASVPVAPTVNVCWPTAGPMHQVRRTVTAARGKQHGHCGHKAPRPPQCRKLASFIDNSDIWRSCGDVGSWARRADWCCIEVHSGALQGLGISARVARRYGSRNGFGTVTRGNMRFHASNMISSFSPTLHEVSS